MTSALNPAETPKDRWEREVLQPALAKAPERRGLFTTISGRPIPRLATPDDVVGIDYDTDIGNPGEFPYARGIHSTGYRGKLWTMRQFAGYGTPEQTNQRYRELIAAGGTGLSVAFDLPTLMGRDPDHALSRGEVGKCGVGTNRGERRRGHVRNGHVRIDERRSAASEQQDRNRRDGLDC